MARKGQFHHTTSVFDLENKSPNSEAPFFSLEFRNNTAIIFKRNDLPRISALCSSMLQIQ